jgi:hypothetical protein
MIERKTQMPAGKHDSERSAADSMPADAGAGESPDRDRLIAEAAYLRAAARNFAGGDPVEDWLQAELEVDTYIADASIPKSSL